MPGRNEQSGEAMDEAIIDEKNSFFVGSKDFIPGISCSPIFDLDSRVIKRAERPKSPLNKGIKGSLIVRAKAANPRKPERIKTTLAEKISSSLKIIYNETKIRRNGIIVFINEYTDGRK